MAYRQCTRPSGGGIERAWLREARYQSLLKSIRVHLDPGSQLVRVLTHTLVVVTTVRIFVTNLRV